jgi:hypothetical protein
MRVFGIFFQSFFSRKKKNRLSHAAEVVGFQPPTHAQGSRA